MEPDPHVPGTDETVQRLTNVFDEYGIGAIAKYMEENRDSVYYDWGERFRRSIHRSLSPDELGFHPIVAVAAGIATFIYRLAREHAPQTKVRFSADYYLNQDLSLGVRTVAETAVGTVVLAQLEAAGLLRSERAEQQNGNPPDENAMPFPNSGLDEGSVKWMVSKLISFAGGPDRPFGGSEPTTGEEAERLVDSVVRALGKGDSADSAVEAQRQVFDRSESMTSGVDDQWYVDLGLQPPKKSTAKASRLDAFWTPSRLLDARLKPRREIVFRGRRCAVHNFPLPNGITDTYDCPKWDQLLRDAGMIEFNDSDDVPEALIGYVSAENDGFRVAYPSKDGIHETVEPGRFDLFMLLHASRRLPPCRPASVSVASSHVRWVDPQTFKLESFRRICSDFVARNPAATIRIAHLNYVGTYEHWTPKWVADGDTEQAFSYELGEASLLDKHDCVVFGFLLDAMKKRGLGWNYFTYKFLKRQNVFAPPGDCGQRWALDEDAIRAQIDPSTSQR